MCMQTGGTNFEWRQWQNHTDFTSKNGIVNDRSKNQIELQNCIVGISNQNSNC